MSTKHLAKGSTCPPKAEGKLRLYSMEFCPFAERVRLVLLAKNVPHDVVNVNLNDKPDWLLDLNPEAKVPVLDTGSQVIAESLKICDFLNEQYPDPPLYPADEDARAREKAFVRSFDEFTGLFYQAVVEPNTSRLERVECMMPHVRRFEDELRKRGYSRLVEDYLIPKINVSGTYFGGDKPGMADYMLWPWGERPSLISGVYGEQLPGRDEFPGLYAWCEAMRRQECVKRTVISAERLAKFLELYRERSASADYDSI